MTCDVSIVIPLYNAAHMVENNVRDIIDYLSARKISYEILLRDDGSLDNTKEIVAELSRVYPAVASFFNETNQGLGASLRELFAATKGTYIVYLDCDLPFGVEAVGSLLQEIAHQDIVVASRYHSANAVRPARRVFSWLYYYFCRSLFVVPVRDIGSGTVMFRRDALKSLPLRASGFDIHIELFVQAQRRRLRIKEVPMTFAPKGTGSFSLLRHGPSVVRDTWKFYKRMTAQNRERGSQWQIGWLRSQNY